MLTQLRKSLHQRDLERAVMKQGWAAALVGRYGEAPSWTHSIGFQETLGQPEVVVFDVPDAQRSALIREVFEELQAGTLTLEDGKTWEREDHDHPAVWRKVHSSQIDCPDGWFETAAARRPRGRGPADDPEVFQLVLSDQKGLLPWDDGYDETARPRQPALFLPAVDARWKASLEREPMRLVRERGWTTVAIEGPLSWAYSIGFPESVGSPNVICFAPARGASRILADVRDHLADGRLALHEGLTWDGLGFEGCWRRVHPSQVMGFQWMLLAKSHAEANAGHRVDIEAYQFFLADRDGRYPWDNDCLPIVRDSQPLLYLPLDEDNFPPRPLAGFGGM